MRLVIVHVPTDRLLLDHAFKSNERSAFDTALAAAYATMNERSVYATVHVPGRAITIARELAVNCIIRVEE